MKTKQFKQTAKVGVAGSFFNQLMSNNSSIPVVGKGATRLSFSDRHCYEVIEVSNDGKTVKMEALDAVADKTKHCDIGHQNWILNPTGRFTTVVWKFGAWRTIAKEVQYVDSYYAEYEKLSLEIGHKLAFAQMIQPLFNEDDNNLKFVEGKTKIKISYPKIRLLFGQKNYYYDWEF